MTVAIPQLLRIGVDCGGTNTDACVLDLSPGASTVVLAAAKTPTTPEVTHGIQTIISEVLATTEATVPDVRDKIQAISIGTTHFVNALVQRSEEHLERVAVIRLCGPFSRSTPVFASFPYELRDILEGPTFFVDGGLQIDGSEICPVNVAEIEKICEQLVAEDIRAVAIVSVYAPIDFTIRQEEQVQAILHRLVPGVYTTCSKNVANIGILERENATILNASLLPFAAMTVAGFREAARALGLDCPVCVTSNDGTLLGLEQAATLPIRTFSSGATNSMRGASFLAKLAAGDQGRRETALVVDIGGTTTEVGVLLPSGFPRQAASHHELCGVRLNFSMPHVTSIGLGGGSRIRRDAKTGKVSVGPDSVGYRILDEAICFGGQTLTATDIVVAAGLADDVGDKRRLEALSADRALLEDTRARIKTMLEVTLDSMKTSADDIPVYLVGGGALLAPEALSGVSQVHRFPHYQCANAVGAAVAQVAGTIDTVEEIASRSIAEVQRKVEAEAIRRAVAAGAIASTVTIIESEAIPIAYTAGRCRFYVKSAGEWGGAAVKPKRQQVQAASSVQPASGPAKRSRQHKRHLRTNLDGLPADILSYRPKVENGKWSLSEVDLEFLNIGTYILGCGGGGSPLHCFLGAREMLRAGHTIQVVDLDSLPDSALIAWGGGMGSPEVASERLLGEEYSEATEELWKFLKINRNDVAALAAVEIGGSNGMINMIAGASHNLNIPIVDGDFMGRAYPTGWQTTPNVYDQGGRGANLLPACIASGDGNVMFMTAAKTDKDVDRALRAACVEMGTLVGQAHRPLSAGFCRRAMIRNTVSLAWRVGRAVVLANKHHNVANIGPVLVEALGGTQSAKVLFSGKIRSVERKVYKGHTIGKVVIESIADEAEDEGAGGQQRFQGTMTIPFKNENLYAELSSGGATEIVATVPDLISVLDAQNGEALGTPDYKYGLWVLVLGITGASQWTDTERGLALGDLRAFNIEGILYKPLGLHRRAESVIEEWTVRA